jgi:hypothetical protein
MQSNVKLKQAVYEFYWCVSAHCCAVAVLNNTNRQRLQEVTAKHSAEQHDAEQRLEEADRRVTELKQVSCCSNNALHVRSA